MKHYKGKKRICLKRLNKTYQRRLERFLQYKIGDYISTCEGFNRQIAKIELEWQPIRPGSRNLYLSDIVFWDSNGGCHWVSGPGCVEKAETNDEIIQSWMEWIDYHGDYVFGDYARKLKTAIGASQPVLTEFGEPLIPIRD